MKKNLGNQLSAVV